MQTRGGVDVCWGARRSTSRKEGSDCNLKASDMDGFLHGFYYIHDFGINFLLLGVGVKI